MKRPSTAVAALALGLVVGLGGALGFSASSPAEPEGACGRLQCGTHKDCTSICGGASGVCVQVDSCNTACSCSA